MLKPRRQTWCSSASSANPSVVSDSDQIACFEGSGTDRTVTITPLAGQGGDVDVTISVSGHGLATTQYNLHARVHARPSPPVNVRVGGLSP